MLNFTTLFDSNYLPKGIVLYNSLLKQLNQAFSFYILCLDDQTYNFFKKNRQDFKYIILIKLEDFESLNKDLLNVKNNRSLVEYYFTLSPILPLFLLEKYNLDHICSMDADLYFYSNPKLLFDNLNKFSIIITPHKFSNELKYLEKYGLHNVSFQIFKNNEIGVRCLKKWKYECLEWCKDYLDELNNRYADQKYLDQWEESYKNSILVLNGPNTGLAVWNINNYDLKIVDDKFFSNSENLIFFHFHKFKSVSNNIILNGFNEYKVKRNSILDILYRRYWNELQITIKKYDLSIDKSIRFKFTKKIIPTLINERTFYLFRNNISFYFNLNYFSKKIKKLIFKFHG